MKAKKEIKQNFLQIEFLKAKLSCLEMDRNYFQSQKKLQDEIELLESEIHSFFNITFEDFQKSWERGLK